MNMRKSIVIWSILSFIVGVSISAIVILFVNAQWDFSLNILDLLMLFITGGLSVVIVYLTKSLDKKTIISDFIVDDFNELCKLYHSNSEIISKLGKNDIDLKMARDEIRMVFHQADLVIDCIRKEVNESMPSFQKYNNDNLVEMTSNYYKWLTDGDIMNDPTFQISVNFQKEHETKVRQTLTALKIFMHKIVKYT